MNTANSQSTKPKPHNVKPAPKIRKSDTKIPADLAQSPKYGNFIDEFKNKLKHHTIVLINLERPYPDRKALNRELDKIEHSVRHSGLGYTVFKHWADGTLDDSIFDDLLEEFYNTWPVEGPIDYYDSDSDS